MAAEIQFSSPRSGELKEIARRFAVGSTVTAFCAAIFLTAFDAYLNHLDHRYDSDGPLLITAAICLAYLGTRPPNFKVAPKFDDRIPFSTAALGLAAAALVVVGIIEIWASPLAGALLLFFALFLTSALLHWVSVDKIRRAVGIQALGVGRLDIVLHEIRNPNGVGYLKSKLHRHVEQEAQLSVETDGKFLDAWYVLQRVGSTDEPKLDGEFRCAVIDVYLNGRHSAADVMAALAQCGFTSTCELSS